MSNSKSSVVVLSLLATLVAVNAGAQTFAPAGELVVRDGGGSLVGQYDGFGRVNTLINNHPVVFDVVPARLATFGVAIYFDQPNCQGTAFINANEVQVVVTTPAAFAPDGTVRIAPSRTASSHAVASNYFDESGQCTNQSATLASALATEMGPNLKTRFAAPFSAVPGTVPSIIVDVPMASRLMLASIAAAALLIALLRLR